MTLSHAEGPTRLSADRIRRSTFEERNRKIDRAKYALQDALQGA